MIMKQISVFVENKRGRLAEITEVLAKNNIDIRALSIADTKDFGILRLIVNNPDKAVEILKADGFTVSITKVIGIGIDDKPGGLAKAMAVLYSEAISVEYMYAFISRSEKTAYVILRVENNENAIKVLQSNGFKIMQSQDI
ncbi:ACT domain-containing protein [Paludicola sp. MB14-C6]|uniref:ACT domain-containing protein n=1 Tax=Paludihabitans sp. MB14-C6 TaxID=3070656 RepID=UPI0027DAECFA|nr:ACT domain-containing protein [Paludicola sp. MB14-C6]WMJ23411.1 ACT domain-containing protein [Paludicola sp. MB14-C6]